MRSKPPSTYLTTLWPLRKRSNINLLHFKCPHEDAYFGCVCFGKSGTELPAFSIPGNSSATRLECEPWVCDIRADPARPARRLAADREVRPSGFGTGSMGCGELGW